MSSRSRVAVLTVVSAGVLGALGFLIMLFEFPLPLLPTFLQFDFGDVPCLLTGLTLGPLAGLLAEVVKCFLFFVSGKDEAGLVGTAANLACGATFVAVAALLHRGRRPRVALSLVAGGLAMLAVTSVANMYVFFPLYGLPGPARLPFLLAGSLPFNAVKALISGAISGLLYRRVAIAFRRLRVRQA
jgi:riboflavin transporter FmnP